LPQNAYQNTTLVQARAALAEKLGDPSQTFWVSDELDGLLRESLQTWNVAALYHRTRSGFSTTPGQAWYDISTVLADADGLVLPRTLTTAQIAKSIVYHLIENNGAAADGTATSTSMFSITDINNAIARRVNRFLEETGQIVTRITLPVASGDGQIDIPNDWIDVRRAGWITPENAHTVLWRVSEYILDSQFNDWNISPSNVPSAYSVAVAPILWLQVAPPPSDIGTLELLIVDSSNSINIFNDFGWVIKFGAMADLLGQEGESRDAERSAYCQQRWDEGIQLAKIMTTVLRVMINGQAVQPCDIFNLDTQVPGWQDSVGSAANELATPNAPAFASANLMALYPVPGVTKSVPDGKHSIVVDTIRNAILPINDSDWIQVGPEFESVVLLDYPFHLATLKCQGVEFQASFAAYKRMFELAMSQNQRLRANAQDFVVLSAQEEIDRPRKIRPLAA
jgi:hypothetical protein